MKKKYLFIFVVVFAAFSAWNIISDTPKTRPQTPASKIEQTAPSSSLDAFKEGLYPYLHFRAAMEARRREVATYVSIQNIPKTLQEAVIATEDRRFMNTVPSTLLVSAGPFWSTLRPVKP